jgi:DNA modification methylase
LAVRLEWEGKPKEVERLSLPFQTVETINESRATRERDAGSLLQVEAATENGRNQLIWGDNKFVISSLLAEHAGKVKLIYIDPPFATGDDFSIRLHVGDSSLMKEPSILEEHAYRDTWGAGYASYLSMVYERLVLMRELLADDGTIYVHCDWHVNSYLRLVLDEVFGSDRFMAEVVWKRTIGATSIADRYRTQTDSLLVYTKTGSYTFNEQFSKERLSPEQIEAKFPLLDPERGRYCTDNLANPDVRPTLMYDYKGYQHPPKGWAISQEKMEKWDAEGRLHLPADKSHRIRRKRFLSEWPGSPVQNLWDDIPPLQSQAGERTGYATQKPEALLARIVTASSNPGDLVADFFVGSGTTVAVAEKLGRRWIACDLGRFAIHTTRKRLLNIRDCRPFDIRNLGAYERQRWQVATGNGVLRAYLDTILAFYRAEQIDGFVHLHGRKADRMVHVGATDAPVTIDETEDVMDEMADNGIEACDLLGWEWEMGLHDTITERARRRGLDLRPRQIPREVMERHVTAADAVRFFELAHVDLDVRRQGHEARVVLKDFAIPSEDLIPPKVRASISSWSDLIDYWSVDFDFSDEIFHNQWQTYRTREIPVLATQSHWHEYPESGRYAIVVKIIDIFGNDTTKLAEVRIK